ncbi:retrotransposon nucleocapsid protein [Gigaspora margarita]|uniref:Retrotransposon nucleocapsid protein n=1 Tax=Gigaspora margarita TaxID=4874 RepID=A0A8H4ERP2_GIGMA|nr:retrotransposon nucleocapsid protein [Gigaspora margarita]
MNNSICRAHNKRPYELVFGGTPHRHSVALDHLFETSITSEDEIPDKLGEMEPLGVKEYPELDHIPSDYVSDREAAQSQNTGMHTGMMCKCKGNYNTNKCRCKKSNVGCGSKFHGGICAIIQV